MPEIRPSSDLRNKYNQISEFCHENGRPVHITKNSKDDLAVMSLATYEKSTEHLDLYTLLEEGLAASKSNNVGFFNDVVAKIEGKLND